MRKAFFPSLFFTIFLCSCSWLSPKQQVPQQSTQYVQAVKVIDKDRLLKGGKLLLVAFNPGQDVAVNAEFDKTAFMILKGIADELKGAGTHFTLLSSEQAQDADLILEGWINSTGRTSLARRMLFRKEKAQIAIEGSLVDRQSGRKVLIFSDACQAENKGQTSKDLGLIVGRDLGQYIVNELTR